MINKNSFENNFEIPYILLHTKNEDSKPDSKMNFKSSDKPLTRHDKHRIFRPTL